MKTTLSTNQISSSLASTTFADADADASKITTPLLPQPTLNTHHKTTMTMKTKIYTDMSVHNGLRGACSIW